MLAPSSFKVFLAAKPSLVPDHVFFHAALVDLHLEAQPPETADGLAVIQKLSKKNPQTEIVAISGNLDRKLMEKSISSGAQRFLAKPLSADEINLVLEKIEAYWSLRLNYVGQERKAVRLFGKSEATEILRRQIAQLKGERKPVLIEGETGVGKDIVARLLNQQEPSRPFITVNCSALTESLFESEFFGHIKGAFTGADYNKIGFAEAAHGGDLFLDEIEALPLTQQAKLLRFLEAGEVRKVGAKDVTNVDVRVIAAGNIPLSELVQQKKFREDLYFRLNAHHIGVKPLRERLADIPEISAAFLDEERGRRNKSFDPAAVSALQNYSWPGNVRELKRVCEQLALTSALPVILESDVNRLIGGRNSKVSGSAVDTDLSLHQFLTAQEKLFIEAVLANTGDIESACDKLKISKSNLYKKIKELEISYE